MKAKECRKTPPDNLGQNLLRHFTKIPIFATHPDKNAYCRKSKDCFPPSPIAMLSAVTQQMHAWAVKPQQHCTRGGQGGEFVSSKHDGWMARHWKLHWNASTVLSGVVAICKRGAKWSFQALPKKFDFVWFFWTFTLKYSTRQTYLTSKTSFESKGNIMWNRKVQN